MVIRKLRSILVLSLVAVLAAGCAVVDSIKWPGQGDREASSAPSAEPEAAPSAPEKAGKARRSAKLKALPTRPLNVKADCSFRDPTGYRGAIKLDVKEARVNRFEANVDVPKHGACRFDLTDFRQTATMPNPVLRDSGSGCEVRMWEQGNRVTVAFSRCQSKCAAHGAWERLWPILVYAPSGRCG
jgi:hypothetical protein